MLMKKFCIQMNRFAVQGLKRQCNRDGIMGKGGRVAVGLVAMFSNANECLRLGDVAYLPDDLSR